MDEFEEEIRKIFDDKFVEKTKNLKKSGHIFDPIFYLFFTRLVEVSAILRDIVLPNKYELEELFAMRRDFLQIDYKTLNELLRRAWIYERSRGIEFGFNKSSEDMLYVIYRMGKMQSEIDEAIMKNVEWRKDKMIDLYFTLLRILMEMEEKINQSIQSEK
ncbi:MAG: hypothetical protein NZ872_01925 [Archaeoglobaceae archaeon]|nr:hypothetical protein [Archaeoglobaceae archaeon]MDW8127956.1 hypothetical protein [Archaeoglobaceae archaeon]